MCILIAKFAGMIVNWVLLGIKMGMCDLSGRILVRRRPTMFVKDGVYSFQPSWLIHIIRMVDEIFKINPNVNFHEIIAAETGVLDVYFTSPKQCEEEVWEVVMRTTLACTDPLYHSFGIKLSS